MPLTLSRLSAFFSPGPSPWQRLLLQHRVEPEVTVSATLRSLTWESLVSATTDTSSVVRRGSVRAEAATARHASQISSATQNMEPLSAPFVDTGNTMRSLRHLDDEECAARAQRGDVAAFSALVARYQDRIFRFLVRLTRSQDDAMELTQENLPERLPGPGALAARCALYYLAVPHRAQPGL